MKKEAEIVILKKYCLPLIHQSSSVVQIHRSIMQYQCRTHYLPRYRLHLSSIHDFLLNESNISFDHPVSNEARRIVLLPNKVTMACLFFNIWPFTSMAY